MTLIFQITYSLSTIALLVGVMEFSSGQHHGGIDVNWIIWGSIPFIVCGAWLSMSSARALAKLENERWASTPEPIS